MDREKRPIKHCTSNRMIQKVSIEAEMGTDDGTKYDCQGTTEDECTRSYRMETRLQKPDDP